MIMNSLKSNQKQEHNRSRIRDRAQVGIGTLIVFIALVLVAAIAAGVLINTAGFLQSQAESTGQQSTEQVTNNLNIVSTTGTTLSDSGNTIDTIYMTVSKAPGAGGIDLTQAEIEVVDSNVGTTRLLHTANDDSVSNEEFTTNEVKSENSNADLITDTGDRTEIVINIQESDGAGGTQDGEAGVLTAYDPGSEISIVVTTQDGGQTFVDLSVPSPFNAPTDL